MTAKIIKLDEYLERFRHSIARSVAHVMGLNPEDENDVRKADQMIVNAAEKKFSGNIRELETNLVAALEAEDDEAVKDLLIIEEWTEETFNGVDLAENYNFRCIVKNEVARNNIMDWLEESGLEYLIDGQGRFAVKCPDRRTEYKVNRQFEHIMNKWDRDPVGKTVDPDPKIKGLTDIKRKGLVDNVNEIAAHQPTYSPGTGKGIETGLGPSMFPANKNKKKKHFDKKELDSMVKESHYPDSEDGVRQLMSDELFPLSDISEIIPDPSVGNVWLAIDHKRKQAFVVYLDDHDAEEVGYDEAVRKYGNQKMESLAEGKKKKKKKTVAQREKEAKEKLATIGPEGSGMAAKMMKDFGLTGTDVERQEKEKKHKEKKNLRKKIKVSDITEALMENDDRLDEHVLGMIGMPTVGRIKELAGLSSDSSSTTTVSEVPISDDAPECEEHNALDLAVENLAKTFEIYQTLNGPEKEEFRKQLINCLMKE